jgi:hypothetical protein
MTYGWYSTTEKKRVGGSKSQKKTDNGAGFVEKAYFKRKR